MTSNERLFPTITDEALGDLRRRIGVPITDTLEPWCHEATRDNIRHYAHGIGDDNPLWCDPGYAATSRFGTIVAPPSFLFPPLTALLKLPLRAPTLPATLPPSRMLLPSPERRWLRDME